MVRQEQRFPTQFLASRMLSDVQGPALTPALPYRKSCPEAREEPVQGSWLLSLHLFSFWVAGKMEKNASGISVG